MRIGFSLLNNQGLDDARAMVELAIRAEALGFDSVWTHDHVFNVGHVFDRIGGKPYYEPLTVLSHVAARTERVRLGTSVLVLPYHNPIRLAKTAATLDVLSGGRLTMGVGVGSIEKETTAMGAPFAERGAFTDEAIAVMRTLWSEDEPKFDGKYSRFAGMKFSPKPLQKPIPVIIGGISRAAIRRAARLGDGWHPLGLSPEALGQSMATLRDEARACGRDATKIPVSIAMTLGASTRGRATLGRAPAEIVKHARAYAELGVETLAISAGTSDPKEARSALEMLALEVLPAIPGRGQ
ncbi:MAG: LLM class F420-dependent oxidoreductase [Candidatus Rokuibacteriota bacterium]|nr:MAG: LLM class F420-dependent oxidoreductase [Candidatus Rokubacteria bacterium]PYN54496.1 MAG: LLM class F420-dependent oxidoreductase [Candidatus Rokubacteria bacterium]